ncbi:hypothetical protein D3C77_139710 [compost metagenome]
MQYLEQLRQAGVEILKRIGVALDVTAVAVGGVEVHEVGEDYGVVTGGLHLFQGSVPQLGQACALHLLGDALLGIDVGNLADGDHLATRILHVVQHGRRRRQHRVVVTVAGALEVALAAAHERTGDDAAYVVGLQQLAHYVAQLIELLEAVGLFVAGDLEHGVGRGVENGLAGTHMLFAQIVQHLGAGGVAVAEVARQTRLLDDGVQQLLGEAVVVIVEVAPLEQHRHAGDLPVTGRGVLAGGELLGEAVGTDYLNIFLQACREVAGSLLPCMAQAQLVEVGQVEGTTAFNLTGGAGLGDMAKGVGAHISELLGIGGSANTEGVHHQNKGTFHGSSPCYKSARPMRR